MIALAALSGPLKGGAILPHCRQDHPPPLSLLQLSAANFRGPPLAHCGQHNLFVRLDVFSGPAKPDSVPNHCLQPSLMLASASTPCLNDPDQ
eukprot:1923818-Amphidinium_carterae.1